MLMQGRRLTLQELSATSNMSLERVQNNVSVKPGVSLVGSHDFYDDQKQNMWKSASKLLFLNKILVSYDIQSHVISLGSMFGNPKAHLCHAILHGTFIYNCDNIVFRIHHTHYSSTLQKSKHTVNGKGTKNWFVELNSEKKTRVLNESNCCHILHK